MSDPFISVIVATYNRPQLLKRALKSLKNQTFESFEVLVVDDASDHPVEGIVTAMEDSRFRFLRHESNKGLSACRNTALKAATGEWICFLDDDDEYLPEKLKKQADFLEKRDSGSTLIYCWMDYFDNGKLVYEHHPVLKGNVFGQILDKQLLGGSPTWMIERNAILESRGFDENVRRGVDGDFLRMFTKKNRVDILPEVLVHVHTNHRSKRLSDSDENGIRQHIKSQKLKLEKFAQDFKRYPKQRARTLEDTAFSYQSIGEFAPAYKFCFAAIASNPLQMQAYKRLILISAAWLRSGFAWLR